MAAHRKLRHFSVLFQVFNPADQWTISQSRYSPLHMYHAMYSYTIATQSVSSYVLHSCTDARAIKEEELVGLGGGGVERG